MKKFVVYFLYTILLVALFLGGCQNIEGDNQDSAGNIDIEQSDEKQTDSEEEITEPYNPMPISEDESITISLACGDNYYAPASLAQNLPVYQEYEKITGVKIKWDVVPNDQYSTSIQTRLAAASDLPDIISMPVDTYRYGKDGLLIPLEDLLDKYGEHAQKAFENKPFLRPLITAPDNHIYQLSGTRDEEIPAGPYGWLIRMDWLKKLELDEPETVEDWYTALKAFKEKDPNGNGQTDEVPLINESGLQNALTWGNSWGLHLRQSDGFYVNEDGKVVYEWYDPKAKEVVQFLNRLYIDGILDPDFLTTTSDEQTSKIIRDIAGATISWQEFTTLWNNKLKESGVPEAEWFLAKIPKGPNGYQGHIETHGLLRGAMCISKDCKNPEVAFRWLDYFVFSDESDMLQTLGIEGETYTVENGNIKMTDFVTNNPDGLGSVEAIRSIGAWTTLPHMRKLENVSALKLSDPVHAERAELYQPYIVDRIEFAIPTTEEFEKTARLYTDITTYRDEMVTKFIMGQEDFNSWDSFVSQLKEMGMDEVLKVRQAQYDRLLQSKLELETKKTIN